MLYDPAGLQVPSQDIIAAPALNQQNNLQGGVQRVNQMAARQGLRGADPTLIQILNRMQERDQNQENTRKKFIMFPKEPFDGSSKSLAKSHWLEFNKYVDYQKQQNLLDPDNARKFPEVKQMFQLTLSNNALGWYDAKNGNSTSMDHIKQAFLKSSYIWDNTRHQQQDTWNKLRFDMSKDDVDAFVTDIKMLASILGHNNEALVKKFEDIFPDRKIEAALIAMDEFDEIPAKAKQLVRIDKSIPGAEANALGLCLMHTMSRKSSAKAKKSQPKVSNQHQLAPV